MDPMILLVVGTVILILAVEFFLWKLFCNKIVGVMFPHETDQSSLSFFTLGRLRACTLLHTTFLLVCSVTAIYFLY
jgi:hypothetical protein